MRPRSATELLDQLAARRERNTAIATALLDCSDAKLTGRPAEGGWSALEAIEHLNRTNVAYYERIARALEDAGDKPARNTFTSSWVGNKLAAGMKPGPKARKVKTFRRLDPLNADLDRDVLRRFLADEERMASFLDRSRRVDLTAVKIRSPLAWILRLRLGDALRLLINHNWRHLDQAARAAGLAELAEARA